MLYLFTAIYQEAYSLIQHYNLKKELCQTRFQVFSKETSGIRLTITGTGMIAAAAAVSSICTEYKITTDDFLINIGSAAGNKSLGEIFLCSKITEECTGKTFYPDMLYRHDFQEAAVTTVAKPFDKTPGNDCLYDMEASAIYQSGSYFCGPHQMIFIKTVSDCGTPGEIKPEQIKNLMSENTEKIAAFLNSLSLAAQRDDQKDKALKSASGTIKKLSADLHCSCAMSMSLKQYMQYLALSDIDYESVINEMYTEQKLPCKDKREGKIYFEELKRRLL